jgi:hypothetical protein
MDAAVNREWWRQLAEERPRAYGAALVTLGAASLWFMHAMARTMGRVSILLTLLAPLLIVFGTQALVLGTKPSSLRGDRTTAGVLFAASAIGAWLAWRWVMG